MGKKQKILLAIIILSATVLRLLAILYVGDFNWDEVFSFTYSQRPWLNSLTLWTWETNPPLHLLLLKLWFFVFPPDEFWQRLPSLIFGVAAVWWVYKTGRDFFSERAGLIAAALLALHPYHIFLSTFGRGYTLLLFLASVSVYYCLKIFVQKSAARRDYWILAAVNLLLAYTHLTAFILLIAETAVVLLVDAKKFRTWLLLHAIPAALWLVWGIPAFVSKATNRVALGGAWFFNFTDNIADIYIPLKLIFFGPLNSYAAGALMILFTLGMLFYFREQIKTKKISLYFISIFIVFLLPLLNTVAMRLWNIRFFIICLPAFIILTAVLIERYFKKWLLNLIIILAVSFPGVIGLFCAMPINNWDDLNSYLAYNYRPDKKQIYINGDFIEIITLNRYYTSPIKKIFYLSPSEHFDWDRAIITGNYIRYARPEEEMQGWYDKNRLDDYDEIFYLSAHDIGLELQTVFEKRGWKFISSDYLGPGKSGRVILRYVRYRNYVKP